MSTGTQRGPCRAPRGSVVLSPQAILPCAPPRLWGGSFPTVRTELLFPKRLPHRPCSPLSLKDPVQASPSTGSLS